MFRTGMKFSAVAMALGATLAVAQLAEAGGYAGNKCISKKQGALGKYAKAVGKAWDKNPSDSVARDAAIADAFLKLDGQWSKAEANAEKKYADCNATTSSSTTAATAINTSANDVTGDQALTGYIAAALKARSKYIKDPVKDPGKARLEAALGDADADHLTGAAGATVTEADELESALVEMTTTAPNYPSTFQTIVPGSTVNYGKDVLSPVCVDNTPYMFFAKRGTGGNANKVVMYYQGGGACWDATSCFGVPGGTCDRTSVAGDSPALTSTGFANYDNPSNPFNGWSVVFVSYCTCDVHWGENIKVYGPGQIARHMGRVNAAVVEKFAREHFVDPEKVFVTGSSAGSYGAIMNSYWLMKDVWPNADFSVLGDAGVGVITQGFLDNYIGNWGVEENFPSDLPGVALPVQDLSLVDLIDGLATNYPNARFANYDASFDGGGGSQCQFFQVMRHPAPPASFIDDWPEWWDSACQWNACMKAFKAENATRAPNYHYFTGAGTRHTMFGSDKVFTETKSTDSLGNGVTIADWVTAMIDETPAWVDIDCNNPGGDCDLTNSCQGGTNAGGLCSPRCSGGVNAGLVCSGQVDCAPTCVGGDNAGLPCTTTADCEVPDPGIDGTCPSLCSAGASTDCPGGSCQLDPDSTNAPLNDDDTVNCPLTDCPCDLTAAECVGGANDGNTCTTDANCTGGSCVYVRCPTFTP